jgi:putative Holliday junction resolvase
VNNHNPEELVGVDVGKTSIGLARGSSLARIAEPLKTVAAADAVATIASLAQDNHATGIVVGLPRGLNGQETEQTTEVRKWVEYAKFQISLPFYWQDEALTSKLAQESTRNKKADEHSRAATIFLQDFLDTPKEEWVRC